MNLTKQDRTNRTKTETSRENVQETVLSGMCLQRLTDGSDRRDECVQTKTNKKENKTINPLSLFKEDLSQFKEEFMNVFKEKDERTADHPMSQSVDRDSETTSSTFSLLKEDLNQLKQELTSAFSVGFPADLKASPSTERNHKTATALSLFKEDFNLFRDDLSNVFKKGLSKEKDKTTAPKEDFSKIKAEKAEKNGTELKRDENVLELEKIEDSVFKGNVSEQSEDAIHAGRITNNQQAVVGEDGEVDINVSEVQEAETPTRLSEALQSEKSIQTSHTDVRMEEEEEEEEEDKPSVLLPWDTLLLHHELNKDNTSDQPGGDLWAVKQFACYLTFDPNTANSELFLSDNNRTTTRLWSELRPPAEQPLRFQRCPQVLCREGLLDRSYWEVEWSGGADIGVTYNSIGRRGAAADCLLGHNEMSWSLECREGSYTPCHDRKRFGSSSPKPFTRRVGVYLDWHAGSLSFYGVSEDAMVHLYTFSSAFTEPLYAGFWVWAYEGAVRLCQVQQDWERLLQ